MGELELASMDVVVVPFPFTDRQASKRRQELVLSSATFNAAAHHCVLAMVTSAKPPSWPGDAAITDLETVGLASACLVRLKLFALDHRLILKRAGQLGAQDQETLAARGRALVFA